MKDINKVILLGRLGADPVRRDTKTGKSMATFSVATNRKWIAQSSRERLEESGENGLDSSVEYEEDTQWHRVVAFSKTADYALKSLKRGQAVYVEGSIRMRTFTDKEGLERFGVEIVAETVSSLPSSQSTPKFEDAMDLAEATVA